MYSVAEIISNNRKKKGLSQPELAAALEKEGFKTSYKTISSWEKSVSEPSIAIFMTLCKILEIADIYEDYFGFNPANQVSRLNEVGREKVREYTELLVESGKFQKQAAEVLPFPARVIRLYTTMVSAGTGNFLEGEDYEVIEAGDDVPEGADFGVRITGDSMKPKFANHQTVWVHRQDYLNNGEIGIFCLNDMSYCKKLQDDKEGLFLISLNKKYDPIPITSNDSFRIFGRIVY